MTRLFFHRYSNRRSLWDLIPPSAPTEAEGLGSESGPRPTATFLSENSRDPQPPNAQHGRHRHHARSSIAPNQAPMIKPAQTGSVFKGLLDSAGSVAQT